MFSRACKFRFSSRARCQFKSFDLAHAFACRFTSQILWRDGMRLDPRGAMLTGLGGDRGLWLLLGAGRLRLWRVCCANVTWLFILFEEHS